MDDSSLSYVRRHLNAGDLAEARAAPTGELTDHEGRPFDLGQALSGRLGYVFFGYTSCPDMCPLTMSALGTGLDLLPDSARRQVLPIFISLDPARDTPERMATWLSNFGPDFVGLTGPEETLEDVLGQMGYRLPPQVIPDEGPYEVAHPPDLFVVTPDGTVRFGYRGDIEPQWIAADAQALLGVDWGTRAPTPRMP